MKTTSHLKSTIIPWVRGSMRCAPLESAFLLVPLLLVCFALSQTAQAVNPAPGRPETSASVGASGNVQNFRNAALLRPAPTITTFDVPGAGTGPGQGTISFMINPAGQITGFYFDASNLRHGFLRAPDGAITTFDAPGADQGTRSLSINPAGAVAGFYRDASFVAHGYLRSP